MTCAELGGRSEIPQKTRDSHFPTASAATILPPAISSANRMSYYDACGKWGQVKIGQIMLSRC